MPVKCCIIGCTNSWWKKKGNNNETIYRTFPEDKEITFHSFPKKKELYDQWTYCIEVCIGQTSFGRNPRVCSAHFKENDIKKRKRNIVLSASAVPSVFPNSNYVDYEVMYPKNKENMEPHQPSTKKMKFDMEHVNSNALSGAFFPPLILAPDDFSMISISSLNESSMNVTDSVEDLANCNDSIQVTNVNDTSPNVPFVPDHVHEPITIDDIQTIGVESCTDNNISINNSSIEATAFGEIHSTPKRKVRYPGDINEKSKMSPNSIRNNFSLCKNKIKMQAKEIYQLKQKVKRQQKQIQTLKELLRKLKIRFGLSGQAVQSIESTFEDDIIEQLKNGRRSRSYTENVKSFALTLNFYSNPAYQYVRRTFGNHLPYSSTLRSWYKTINANPGISVEALTILKSMADDMIKRDKTLFLALMTDEMAIRKQLIWNETGVIRNSFYTELSQFEENQICSPFCLDCARNQALYNLYTINIWLY